MRIAHMAVVRDPDGKIVGAGVTFGSKPIGLEPDSDLTMPLQIVSRLERTLTDWVERRLP